MSYGGTRKGRKRGFTITEIMVALLVTVFCIVPLLNLNTISRRRGQQGEAYALAQIEADRLINHYVGTLGYQRLNFTLGNDDQLEFGEADPDVADVIASSTGLEQSARNVKRQVLLRRLSPGLLMVTARIDWQSTAPVKDLQFGVDRLIGNPRESINAHPPFVTPVGPRGCN